MEAAGVATTPVGAPGTGVRTTEGDGPDAGPAPATLVAVTLNVYAVPFARPVMVQVSGPEVQTQVAPPGDAVAV